MEGFIVLSAKKLLISYWGFFNVKNYGGKSKFLFSFAKGLKNSF